MFGKWGYQNKVNDEIIAAAQSAFGRLSGFGGVLAFMVHGNAMGIAVDALYKQAPPLIAAQAAVKAQIDLCTEPNDEASINKWNKVLRALEAKEASQLFDID